MFKHDSLDELQRKLLDKHIISFGGEVDPRNAMYFRESFLRLTASGSPEVTICITSDGGDVDIGLDMYDMVRCYAGKTTGIVQGYARSMAAIILQACTSRKVYAHSDILIHHIARRKVQLDDLRSTKRNRELLAELEKSQAYLDTILSKRTGKSIAVIKRACKRNKDMTAREALVFGLVDEII